MTRSHFLRQELKQTLANHLLADVRAYFFFMAARFSSRTVLLFAVFQKSHGPAEGLAL